MLVHNRTTTVALLVAAGAVVLLGFGCDGAKTPPETTGTDVSGVTWTTYESPTLGIRVPYPEGWYVEEGTDGERLHSLPAPEVATEYPADAWTARARGTIAEALDGLTIISSEQIERSGKTMSRVVFREDYYNPPEVLLYLWERDSFTYEIGGPNHAVVERMVAAL